MITWIVYKYSMTYFIFYKKLFQYIISALEINQYKHFFQKKKIIEKTNYSSENKLIWPFGYNRFRYY